MTDKLGREIGRLFGDDIVAFGKQAADAGVVLLETRWKADAPSYFVKRPKVSMAKTDFEVGGCASLDSVAADLDRLWAKQEDKRLASLAPAFAGLAKALRKVEAEASDVSNFVYVMY